MTDGQQFIRKKSTKSVIADKKKTFAQEHMNWSTEKWINILWTDESKIVFIYMALGLDNMLDGRQTPNIKLNIHKW